MGGMGRRAPPPGALPRSLRALARLAVVTACAFAARGATGDVGARAPETEAKVKVAYVYNFPKFIEWPDAGREGVGSPIRICTVGSGSVVVGLDGLARRDVGGRPIQVEHVDDPGVQPPCHVLFIARSEEARLQPLLERLQRAPVLTVSDIPGFARSGGMIGFFAEDDRVRIEISQRAVRQSGLRVSAKVLEIARVVP